MKNKGLYALLAAGIMSGLPYCVDKYIQAKSYTCKQCGKEFKSVSHNKTVFCCAECFKEYKNKGTK